MRNHRSWPRSGDVRLMQTQDGSQQLMEYAAGNGGAIGTRVAAFLKKATEARSYLRITGKVTRLEGGKSPGPVESLPSRQSRQATAFGKDDLDPVVAAWLEAEALRTVSFTGLIDINGIGVEFKFLIFDPPFHFPAIDEEKLKGIGVPVGLESGQSGQPDMGLADHGHFTEQAPFAFDRFAEIFHGIGMVKMFDFRRC